jgi:hypothetical protein
MVSRGAEKEITTLTAESNATAAHLDIKKCEAHCRGWSFSEGNDRDARVGLVRD